MNNTPSSLLVCSGEEWYVNTANHVRKLAARKLAFCLSENPSVQMDLREFLDVKKFTSILVSDGFLTRLIFDFLDWRNGYEIVKKGSLREAPLDKKLIENIAKFFQNRSTCCGDPDDCRIFIHTIFGIPLGEQFEHKYWRQYEYYCPDYCPPGSVLLLVDADDPTPFPDYHYALSIGRSLYLSILGPDGPPCISTFEELYKLYPYQHTLLHPNTSVIQEVADE